MRGQLDKRVDFMQITDRNKLKRKVRMPIVIINGLPHRYPQKSLARLKEEVRSWIAAVPELFIQPENVTVFCPSDLCPETGMQQDIVAHLEFFKEPARTLPVIEKMRYACAQAIRFSFRTARIEVILREAHRHDTTILSRENIKANSELPTCSVCGAGRQNKDGDKAVHICVNCGDERSFTLN